MDGLQEDDVSTTKHLEDLIISQMQSVYGVEYAHNMTALGTRPIRDVYTKFDVAFIKVGNIWQARGIVYLRGERPSTTDVNEHMRYKVLACGQSTVDVIGALRDLWNELRKVTDERPLLQDIKTGEIYPDNSSKALKFVDWLRLFAEIERIFR